MEVGQIFQLLSLVVVIVLAIINLQNARANKNEDKKEDLATKLILSEFKQSEIKIVAEIQAITKVATILEKKVEEMDRDMKERIKDSHEKDQTIKDLVRQVDENKKWIDELKGRYKSLEHSIGMKNVTDIVLKKQDNG